MQIKSIEKPFKTNLYTNWQHQSVWIIIKNELIMRIAKSRNVDNQLVAKFVTMILNHFALFFRYAILHSRYTKNSVNK